VYTYLRRGELGAAVTPSWARSLPASAILAEQDHAGRRG